MVYTVLTSTEPASFGVGADAATGSMTDDELAKLLQALDAAFPHRSHFLVVPSGGLNVVASPPICPDPVPQESPVNVRFRG
jgi:hypothetical protein